MTFSWYCSHQLRSKSDPIILHISQSGVSFGVDQHIERVHRTVTTGQPQSSLFKNLFTSSNFILDLKFYNFKNTRTIKSFSRAEHLLLLFRYRWWTMMITQSPWFEFITLFILQHEDSLSLARWLLANYLKFDTSIINFIYLYLYIHILENKTNYIL